MSENQIDPQNLIFPPSLYVMGFGQGIYRNAAYALAELIDNSIEAGAKNIQVIAIESSGQIEKVAVLDNGKGMDVSALRVALQVGNGERKVLKTHKGLGKYGVGLPTASISQAQRVDVYSWTNDIKDSLHTYLDVAEMMSGAQCTVPVPTKRSVPNELMSTIEKNYNAHGTLVVWSRVDRCTWKLAKTLLKNCGEIVGRIYRRYLSEGQVKIELRSLCVEDRSRVVVEKVLPLDPGYLTRNSQTPAPFDVEPMFERFPADEEFTFFHRNQQHTLRVVYSTARAVAREVCGINPGSTPHGRHAGKHGGISIVRAGREIQNLDVIKNNDPTERWWNVEISFEPDSDELLGVSTDKQSSRVLQNVLSSSSSLDDESRSAGFSTSASYLQYLDSKSDPRAHFLRFAERIKKTASLMRKLVENQTAGQRTRRGHTDNQQVAIAASNIVNRRRADGYLSKTDQHKIESKEEQISELEKLYPNSQTCLHELRQRIRMIVEQNLKFDITSAPLDTSAFFSVVCGAGKTLLALNSNHSVFKRLFAASDVDSAESCVETLQSRLNSARNSLLLVLMAWARLEDEATEKEAEQLRLTRQLWGRMASEFLE